MHSGSQMLCALHVLTLYAFCEQNSEQLRMQLISAAVPYAYKAISSLQVDPGVCLLLLVGGKTSKRSEESHVLKKE